MKPHPHKSLAQPLDFRITPEIRSAAQCRLPAAVYAKYRQRVLTDLGLGRTAHLHTFLRQVLNEPEFLAAYFHPTPEALRLGGGGDGKGKDTWYGDPDTVELDDWPYRLALHNANRVSQWTERTGWAPALARVAAFIYPCGLLRMWDIVRRGGGDPHAYARSTFGESNSRFVRGVLVRNALQAYGQHHPAPTEVLGWLLDEKWTARFHQANNQTDLQTDLQTGTQALIARVGAAVLWSQVGLRQDLTNRPVQP